MAEPTPAARVLRQLTWEQGVHSGATISGTGLKVAALFGAVFGFVFGPGLPVLTPQDFLPAMICGALIMPLFACGAWMVLMGQHWEGKDRNRIAEEDMIRSRQRCTATLSEGPEGLELAVETTTLSGHRPFATALLWIGLTVLLPIAALILALLRRYWPRLRESAWLSWRPGAASIVIIRHATIEGFELSTGNAWFSSGTRGGGIDSWVILAHITGKGPVVIAEDLRSKARMARLFGEITTAFGPDAVKRRGANPIGFSFAAPDSL